MELQWRNKSAALLLFCRGGCCSEERKAKSSCCDREMWEQVFTGLPFFVYADDLDFLKWHFAERRRSFVLGEAEQKEYLQLSPG